MICFYLPNLCNDLPHGDGEGPSGINERKIDDVGYTEGEAVCLCLENRYKKVSFLDIYFQRTTHWNRCLSHDINPENFRNWVDIKD